MRNKDTRLIWESLNRGNAFRVDRGDLPPNPNDSEFANWVAGKAGSIYLPTAVISDFAVEDSDGLVVLSMTLTSFAIQAAMASFI